MERPDAVNRALRRFIEAPHTATGQQAGSVAPALHNRYMDMPWLQHYDDGVPEQLPLPDLLLHDLLSNNAVAYPRTTALIFAGQKIGYRELESLSNRFAHALQNLGLTSGERVAIVLPNVPQCVIGFFGTLKAGGVVVLGSPLSREDEIANQLRDSGASILLTLSSYRGEVERVCQGTGVRHVIYTDVREYLPLRQRLTLASSVENIVPYSEQGNETLVVTRPSPGTALSSWREYAFQHLLRRQPQRAPDTVFSADQLALIQYTSGTTDVPRGVMLSHRNLMKIFFQHVDQPLHATTGHTFLRIDIQAGDRRATGEMME